MAATREIKVPFDSIYIYADKVQFVRNQQIIFTEELNLKPGEGYGIRNVEGALIVEVGQHGINLI